MRFFLPTLLMLLMTSTTTASEPATCGNPDGDPISGIVMDLLRAPVSGIVIEITSSDGLVCSAVTDDRGEYSFLATPGQTYLVQPQPSPTLAPSPAFQTVEAEQREVGPFLMVPLPRDNGVYISFGKPPSAPKPKTSLDAFTDSFSDGPYTYFWKILHVGNLGRAAEVSRQVSLEGSWVDPNGEPKKVELIEVKLEDAQMFSGQAEIAFEDRGKGQFAMTFTAPERDVLKRDGYLAMAFFRVRNHGKGSLNESPEVCFVPTSGQITMNNGQVIEAVTFEECSKLQVPPKPGRK